MSVAEKINNEFYHSLGERWYHASDDPIALLRAESRLRNPWVIQKIRSHYGDLPVRVLDVGCGGGFLSNELGRSGYEVTGVDLSEESLAIARQYDPTGRVEYKKMDALDLRFVDNCFHAVCAMDFIEHTDRPEQLLREVSRVLAPGGLFFFHTFAQNFFSWLFVIKGVEWVVKNTPKRMHTYDLLVNPNKLTKICDRNGLQVEKILGVRPVFSRAFRELLQTGSVPEDFSFCFSRILLLGYSGVAIKR